jgi:hypothetical protein
VVQPAAQAILTPQQLLILFTLFAFQKVRELFQTLAVLISLLLEQAEA